jgi:cold shock CspA family protein
VAAFDDAAGLGDIEVADGGRVPFHCVAIADGSRTIAVGTPVRFEVRWKLGRREAAAVEPIG